jgi:hypothetical protein
MRNALCVVFLILLVGCNEPRLDCSSTANRLASIEKMKAEMTPEQKNEFDMALGMAIMDDILTPAPFGSVDGKTAKEIVAIGKAKIAAIKARVEKGE